MDSGLRRSGVPAQAEILEIKGNRVGDYDSAAPAPMRFRLRIHPKDADPVEAEVKQLVPINLAYHLEPGAWIPVVHDPADPSKVAVDLAGESDAAQAELERTRSAYQDYIETVKRTTGEDLTQPATQADVTDALRTAQQLAEQNAALMEWAKQAGVPGMQPPGGAAGAAASGSGDDDPIEKIERLAKLHESGAISDQEFERLKGEILG